MLFFVVHVILCVLFLWNKDKYIVQKSTDFPMVIVFILPVFGFLMWWIDYVVTKKRVLELKEVEVEKLRVTDEKYRRLQTEGEKENEHLIPLEDAFASEDSKLRRSLLLDILQKNPEEYLQVLDRARGMDDVEVTHYATTTLLEIQSDFEQRIQNYKRELEEGRKDRAFFVEYSECLKKYVDSGLIDGTVLRMQQENLLDVVNQMLQTEHTNRKDAFLYIETALDLKAYEDAKAVLDSTEKENEESEIWNRLAVRYYWETGQTEQIEVILQRIVDSQMYLSKKGKEWFKFWSKGKKYETSIGK